MFFWQGEEIFNTFGRLGNAELLQMYGYTEDENAHDTVSIKRNINIFIINQHDVRTTLYGR